MSWTLAQARENLAAWIEAERSIAISGQSYRIGSRNLTRASLKEIADRIAFWRNEVARLEKCRPGGTRVLRVVPRDL